MSADLHLNDERTPDEGTVDNDKENQDRLEEQSSTKELDDVWISCEGEGKESVSE